MTKVNAIHGRPVCWGAFKSRIVRDEAQQFLLFRLWCAGELIDELPGAYDNLYTVVCALIPLKRVWTLAPDEA